jgi:endonuclease/exonuclease/phosphatase family metal-dependent hydrolase
MTYNVGNGMAEPNRLADLLREMNADVVGLQELAAPQAQVLATALANVYAHQVLLPAGFAGKGLLSRYPILHQEQLALYADRPDLRVVVDVMGLPLNILVAHPPPPRIVGRRLTFPAEAIAQLDALSALALEHAPGVLLGDFNMTPRNPVYARFIAAGLVDSFASAGSGRGLTLPRRVGQSSRFEHRLHRVPLRPVARVDYIWHTPELNAEMAWIGNDAGSDHLPVLARIGLPDTD